MYVEHIQALQNRARKNVDEDAGVDVDVHPWWWFHGIVDTNKG